MVPSCEEAVKALAVLQDNDASDLLELKQFSKSLRAKRFGVSSSHY